jgi:PAS domain S-box-containing protein
MTIKSFTKQDIVSFQPDLIKRFIELCFEGVFIENLEGDILECNDSGCKMFGYTKKEMLGKNIRDFLMEEDAVNLPKPLTEDHLTDNKYLEKINKRKDGSLIYIEIKINHIFINKKKYRIAFIRDISEKKKLEEERLKTMKMLLERNRTKNLIISTISHDLLNYFGNLKNLVDIFDSPDEYGGLDRVTSFIPLLKKSAYDSYDLLNSLLNWAHEHIHQPTFAPKQQNLKPIATTTLQLFTDRAQQKKIQLNNLSSENAWAWFDSHMISSVLRNLISNALKFTPSGGSITLQTECTPDYLNCSIHDTGLGMSPTKLSTLFNLKTHSSEPGTNNEKGNGLGLILCKEFVEQNHGQLTVQSQPGEGTCFTFTLPVQPPSTHSKHE